MVSLGSSLQRLRKFLRDPDGDIWTDAMLLAYWKRGLVEVAQMSHAVTVAEALPWPPRYGSALCYRWEESETEGSVWFPFTYAENLGMAVTANWEAAYNEADTIAEDNAGSVTQPWETAYSETEQIIPLTVGGKHLHTVFAAYDEDHIEPASLQAIGNDPWYRSRFGDPTHYYWWDETRMQMALYPKPSPVITDVSADDSYNMYPVLSVNDVAPGTIQGSLSSVFITGGGYIYVIVTNSTSLEYLAQFSADGSFTDMSGGYGSPMGGEIGVVLNYGEYSGGTITFSYTSTETGQTVAYSLYVPVWKAGTEATKTFLYDHDTLAPVEQDAKSVGLITFEDSDLETSLSGIVVDSIATSDSLFLVYEAYAEPDGIYDEVDYPEYLAHYVEMAVLGYAFSADTDGFAAQMRDYWLERKKIGFAQLRRLLTAKTRDRVVVRGGGHSRRIRRGVTLPSNYDDRGR